MANEHLSHGRRWGRWVALAIGVMFAIGLLLAFAIVETSWFTGWYGATILP